MGVKNVCDVWNSGFWAFNRRKRRSRRWKKPRCPLPLQRGLQSIAMQLPRRGVFKLSPPPKSEPLDQSVFDQISNDILLQSLRDQLPVIFFHNLEQILAWVTI